MYLMKKIKWLYNKYIDYKNYLFLLGSVEMNMIKVCILMLKIYKFFVFKGRIYDVFVCFWFEC